VPQDARVIPDAAASASWSCWSCCSWPSAAGLLSLQVVSPEAYVARGEAQRLRTVALPAERGAIFDRNGAELALSIRQQTVWADPRLVTDPERAAAQLAPVLRVEADVLEDQLRTEGAFVYLARKVGDDVAARVTALDLDGISLLDESKRFAPAGSLATSLIGSVDLDNTGTSGLERQYEDVLVGEPGTLSIERGSDGRTIAAGATSSSRPTAATTSSSPSTAPSSSRSSGRLGDQIAATGRSAGGPSSWTRAPARSWPWPTSGPGPRASRRRRAPTTSR
jgi:hypothetical protein